MTRRRNFRSNNNKKRRNAVTTIPIDAPVPEFADNEQITFTRRTNVDGVFNEVKIPVPKLRINADFHEKIKFFKSYEDAREDLHWATGEVLFANMRILLRDNDEALQTWNQTITNARSVAAFDTAFVSLRKEMLKGLKYRDQVTYLRTIKKPPTIEPNAFKTLLITANNRLNLFPDVGDDDDDVSLSEDDLIDAFFRAMPQAWQLKYKQAGLKPEEEEFVDVCAYMQERSQEDPYEPNSNENSNRQNGNGNGNSNNNGNRNSNNSNSRQGNGNNRNNNGNRNNGNNRGSNNNNNNSNNSSRIQPNDPCPLPGHGGHTWYNCRANRFGCHGDDSQRPPNNSNNGNNNRENHNVEANSSSVNGEQHFVQFEMNATGREIFQFDDIADSFDDIEPEIMYCQACVEPCANEANDVEAPEVFQSEASDVNVSNHVPSTLTFGRQINNVPAKSYFKTLLDHGASHTMVNRRALPKNVQPIPCSSSGFTTTAGSLTTSDFVYIDEWVLPEFNRNRYVKRIKAFVFDAPNVAWDMLVGRNHLNQIGIDVLSSSLSCKWCGDEIPFHSSDYWKNTATLRAVLDDSPRRVEQQEANLTFTATDSTFADVHDVANSQAHLSIEQRAHLRDVLNKHTKLFSGKLGCYPHREFHIDLKPDAVPYHCKQPYSIPAALKPIVKAELDRQVNLGILERVYETQWGMPMICIAKKNGNIRTVDDFRELNKAVLRRVYPLPKILDMIRRHHGWQFITVIDVTAAYYSYKLDEESSNYCVIVTPFGKFKRLRLSQGLSQSPDWAQGALEEVLKDELHTHVECYIDDIAIFSKTFEEHMEMVQNVLTKLQDNGYTVNPAKCNWAVAECEWLGHYVSKDGLKPWPKKVQGILSIAPPQTLRQLRAFIGCVNFYRDFWKHRAHVMAPLTALTKVDKRQFKSHWTPECDEAFRKTKAMIAEDILLAIPDPTVPFDIETDASDYQLGAIIYQANRPIAMFSRKLTSAQRNYPASDKEALCIQEVLQEFRAILYGAVIRIHTDHANLSKRDLKSQRLLHWRLLIEEFAPEIIYKPGVENVVADGLSRLPLVAPEEKQDVIASSEVVESNYLDQLGSKWYDMAELFMYYPEEVDSFPLDFPELRQAQMNDADVRDKVQQNVYEEKEFGDTVLATKKVNDQYRIVVPEALVDPTITWYHLVLGHCGQERMIKTLRNHLFVPGLEAKVKSHVESCDKCQRYKNPGPGQGHLPARDEDATPFADVALDCIGPWTINVPGFGELKFKALTIIDIATTLIEIARLDHSTSQHAALQFENQWLSRHPRPTRCLYDQGSEFIGPAFQACLAANAIRPVPISIKNPQSNAIVERAHGTIGNILRTLLRETPPNNVETAYELIDTALASAQRALRSAVHKTFGISPGAMVFQRDMLLDVPVLSDFNLIRNKRQALIDHNNLAENRKRRYRNYQVGDEILIAVYKPTKLQDRFIGPFVIDQVHVNGTVTIERRPGVFERLSIRRIHPYHRRD